MSSSSPSSPSSWWWPYWAGGVSTEDLRKAVVHYRALFEALLDERGAEDDRTTVDVRDGEAAQRIDTETESRRTTF